ncbi:MAG: sulfatase [Candidatus Omnitrophica bacterium]|nr:sulfatase [Candidatus Omnitrophota bacterium]
MFRSAVIFQMMRFLVGVLLCAVSATGVCAADGPAASSAKPDKFNVVLVILDALRPDHLGCYGYAKNTSPNIDALGKEGAIFKDAFTPFPLTLPGVVSMFTSLYPQSHQIKHIYKDRLSDKVYTLAQIVRIYGYSTAWFGATSDPHTGAAPGLLRGFEKKRLLMPMWSADPVLSWIKQHDQKPFFVTVHSYQTHEVIFPYAGFKNQFSLQAPSLFRDEIGRIDETGWRIMQENLKSHPGLLYDALGKAWVEKYRSLLTPPYSKKAVRDLYRVAGDNKRWNSIFAMLEGDPGLTLFRSYGTQKTGYLLSLLDASIWEVDRDLIGRLVATLKERGVYDKTIIIITADHGNEYKDHGQIGHGPALYDESLRVPLIVRVPGAKPGIQVDSLVEAVDILPSVCDILGMPVPYQAQGISWRRDLEGSPAQAAHSFVISESIGTDLVAIRSKRWKLIMEAKSGKPKELFDLEKDPHELNNVIADRFEMSKELQDEYILKVKELPLYQDGSSEFVAGVSDALREKIKKTGYW